MRRQLVVRDQRTAALTAASIYLVAAIVIAASDFFVRHTMAVWTQLVAMAISVLMVAIGVVLLRGRSKWINPLLITCPLLGVAIICALNLTSNDASAAAQVSLCLPVLYSASQLRILAAGAVAAAAILGDAITVVHVRPNVGGLLDLIYVSSTLLLMTGLLAMAMRRQERLVALLEHQAAIDPLTGLVTRRVLDAAAHSALATSTTDVGTALILIDIDHFKSINDTHGHPVGDDALIHVARVVAGKARPETVISRLGGDELAVLLPATADEVARRRAQDLVEAVRVSPFTLPDGSMLPISISVGVAHAPRDAPSLKVLYANADASLYDAKRNGRGRVGGTASTIADKASAAP